MSILSDLALAQAMVANARWAAQLTWDCYVEPIDRSQASEDFAKQLFTLIGTLMTVVASFYFAS
jgi:hypothetical protein